MFHNSRPTFVLIRLVAAAAFLLVTIASAHAQNAKAFERARAEQLTHRLAALSGAVEADGQTPELEAVAAERHAIVSKLMKTDPAEAVRLAVPPGLRAKLPASIAPLVEEDVEFEGDLEVAIEDYEWGGVRRYAVHAGGHRYALHVAGADLGAASGDRVRVKGIKLDANVAADGAAGGVTVLATSVVPYSFGEQRVLWILVNFRNNIVEPYTAATAHSLLFTTVNGFYDENSQGQTWFTGDVAGWFTIDMDSTVCDAPTLRTLARQAAANAGVDLARYQRFVYGFPKNACSWLGLGQIGGASTYALVNGSPSLRVVGHELGHNMGLSHAHALECGAATLGASCSTIDYGDPADIMGVSGVVAHFNSFNKERLGWLNYGQSLPIATLTSGGTFTLEPYATQTPSFKALSRHRGAKP